MNANVEFHANNYKTKLKQTINSYETIKKTICYIFYFIVIMVEQ